MKSFYEQLDQVIYEQLRKTLDFYYLTNCSLGICPLDIIDSINRLMKSGRISREIHSKLLKDSQRPLQHREVHLGDLPVPHWLDHDWRFSVNGINAIYNRMISYEKEATIKSILFIGTPSLFKFAMQKHSPTTDYYLLDFNAMKHLDKSAVPKNFHFINCDMNYDIENTINTNNISADLVIMDPPWYNEYYNRLFSLCEIICNDKSRVICVCPPIMTRPHVMNERNILVSNLASLGFSDVLFEENALTYNTPPFEHNVFRVNRILNYSYEWRTGSILYSKFSRRGTYSEKYPLNPIATNKWFELSIGAVRIKLLPDDDNANENMRIHISSIFSEDIYPAISRRFINNNRINVWTSGHRVFFCDNIPLLVVIIENFSCDSLIAYIESEYNVSLEPDEKEEILAVRRKLESIVAQELREYGC